MQVEKDLDRVFCGRCQKTSGKDWWLFPSWKWQLPAVWMERGLNPHIGIYIYDEDASSHGKLAVYYSWEKKGIVMGRLSLAKNGREYFIARLGGESGEIWKSLFPFRSFYWSIGLTNIGEDADYLLFEGVENDMGKNIE